jgi:hypothetical protein
MADPNAVSDETGEWVELYNGDSVPINLNGWILADQDSDRAVLSGDVWLPPSGYIVIARLGDPAQNGGVTSQVGYAGMQLANESDELSLAAPNFHWWLAFICARFYPRCGLKRSNVLFWPIG